MRDMIIVAIFVIALAFMVVTGIEREDRLVEKYCGHLTGYEFGKCQMNIY